MGKAGRDYIFKLMSPEFVDSLFNLRRRYFLRGTPSELMKGNAVFFVAKFPKSQQVHKEYDLIGDGKVKAVGRLEQTDRDYEFATGNGWRFVVDFENLSRYSRDIPATDVFSQSVLDRLNSQRPFGVELSAEESRIAKLKLLESLLS